MNRDDVVRMGASCLLTLAVGLAAPVQASPLPQRAAQSPGQATAPAGKPQSADGRAPSKSDPAFDKLVAGATEARRTEQWEEAIALYAKAVAAQPDYVEGWWYQGTAYYSLDEFESCRDMFRKVTRLAPQNGAGFAFLGLCEFGVKEYDRALQHLLQSRILGVGDAPDLGSVARYHAAVLMTRTEQYEQALETLGEFANEGEDNPRVIEAMGIATLRMPMLPIELPPDRRERVIMAGRASYMMATRNTASAENAFAALAARYPEAPNVHYAFGVFLLQEKADQAIEQFKRELELQPGHPASLMQLAFEYLNRGDGATALTWAKQAVEADPKAFAARKALGQALLDTGNVDAAIAELQKGIDLAPESPSLFFQLARAYQRAGRLEEAAKAREEFTRLDRLARTNRSGPQSVGGR
jgi:tetratricopeptide (TPR) repeat protein